MGGHSARLAPGRGARQLQGPHLAHPLRRRGHAGPLHAGAVSVLLCS